MTEQKSVVVERLEYVLKQSVLSSSSKSSSIDNTKRTRLISAATQKLYEMSGSSSSPSSSSPSSSSEESTRDRGKCFANAVEMGTAYLFGLWDGPPPKKKDTRKRKWKDRQVLQQATEALLVSSEDKEDTGLLCAGSLAVSLALQESSSLEEARAVASAMVSVVVAKKTKTTPSNEQLELIQEMFSSLLLGPWTVDLHIVASFCEALKLTIDDPVAAHAIQRVMDARPNNNNNEDDDAGDYRQSMAAVFRLAAVTRPWTSLSPVYMVEQSTALDLWHGAECMCETTIGTSHPLTAATVQALVDCATQAHRYRQADDYASRWYEAGGKHLLLSARLNHAYSTIAKVIQKRQWSIIDTQIQRVDASVERVKNDPDIVVETANASDARELIRSYAIQHLVQAGELESAQRLSLLYGREFEYSPEAIQRAADARKKRYLQWDELLTSPIPELLDTPHKLRDSFATLLPTTTTSSAKKALYGFDCEWDGENDGAALLQLASWDTKMVLLIDIPALTCSKEGMLALQETVGHLFSCPNSIVVGFDCHQDLHKLRTSKPKHHHHHLLVQGTTAVVDLRDQLAAANNTNGQQQQQRIFGLSKTCQHYLGKELDKSEQCSQWGMRPLSQEQRIYAALDAYVCAILYETIVAKQQQQEAANSNT